jgi:hypothetical protein
MFDEPLELIPVDTQSDDPIVQTFGLRKAHRPAHHPLDPRPQIDGFALDFLGVLFADGVLRRRDMPLIGTHPSVEKRVMPKGSHNAFRRRKTSS